MDAIRAAKDQSLFRGVNERLLDMSEGFEPASGDAEFLCECASQDCIKPVSLSLDDYEEIRRVPTHFAITDSMDHVFARAKPLEIAASEATRHCSPDAVAGRPPMRASTRPLSSTSCGSPLSSAA